MVSKAAYREWERRVIQIFYSKPPNGYSAKTVKPSPAKQVHVVKQKAVVVADIVLRGGQRASALVHKNQVAALPSKTHVPLYHAGRGEAEAVAVGVDPSKPEWRHPATDTGGITALRQPYGSRASFVPRSTGVTSVGGVKGAVSVSEATKRITDSLKAASGKPKLHGPVQRNVGKWVRSLQEMWVSPTSPIVGAELRVSVFPPEHRVVMTADSVLKATGHYYLRNFGDGTQAYARPAGELGNLFMAVTEKYITPNINEANLRNEYIPFGERRQP